MGALTAVAVSMALACQVSAGDSLDAIDAVVETLPPGVDPDAVVENVVEDMPAWYRAGAGRVRATWVYGDRHEESFRVRPGGGVSAGGRRVRGEWSAHLAYRGGGIVREAVLGRARLRMGEGLVAGVGSSLLSAPSRRDARSGIDLSASTSRLRGRTAAGAVTRLRDVSVAAFISRDGEARKHRLVAVEFARGDGFVGAAGGTVPSTTRRGIPVACVFARGGGVSGETAIVDGRVLAVARWVSGPWAVEVRSGVRPAGYGDRLLDAASAGRRRRSVAMARRISWRGAEYEVSCATLSEYDETRVRRRRRIDVSAAGATTPSGRWGARVRVETDTVSRLDGEPLRTPVRRDTENRGEVRLRVSLDTYLRHDYDLRIRFSGDDPAPLVNATLRAGANLGRLSVRASASGYSVPGDGTGYVVRPGASVYDAVGIVTRSGSDLSARLELDAAVLGVWTVAAIRPWRRAARVRLTARWSL